MAKEHTPIYPLPENFIEGGRIVNGLFKTRNFIEAIILSVSMGFLLWHLPVYNSITVKVAVSLCGALPLFMLGVIGINGQSLFQFLRQFIKWRKERDVILYNYNTKSRAVRPMRVMFAQEMPKDKLVNKFDEYKEQQRKKNSKTDFVEGKDFEFLEEEFSQGFLNTEKKLLGIESEPEKKKKNKKRKTSLFNRKNKKAAAQKKKNKKKVASQKKSKQTTQKSINKTTKQTAKSTAHQTTKKASPSKKTSTTKGKPKNAVKLTDEITITEI